MTTILKCNAVDCDNDATLHCPTCQSKNIDYRLSAFCSQDCFKSCWKSHKKIHIDTIASPVGNYNYVLIPVEPGVALVDLTGDLSKGLEEDEVQAVARLNFFGPEKRGVFQMVDICTLLIACNRNGYIGISMYSSGDAMHPLNQRATDIVQACGHKATLIYGDAYISRCYDNEAAPWIRRDLMVSEVDVSAPWVAQAALLNYGRNMDAFTSGGAAEKAVHQLVKGGVDQSKAGLVAAVQDDDWLSGNAQLTGNNGKTSKGRNQNKRWAKGKEGYYRPAQKDGEDTGL